MCENTLNEYGPKRLNELVVMNPTGNRCFNLPLKTTIGTQGTTHCWTRKPKEAICSGCEPQGKLLSFSSSLGEHDIQDPTRAPHLQQHDQHAPVLAAVYRVTSVKYI